MNRVNPGQSGEERGVRIRRERAAGTIAYRRRGKTTLVLLVSDSFRKWAAPKGHMDFGETDEQAALRELHEEAGVSGMIEGDLGTIMLKFRRKNTLIKKTVHYFLVRVPWHAKVQIEKRTEGRGERLHGYRWVPLRKALHLVAYENMRPVIAKAASMLEERYEKAKTPHQDTPASTAPQLPLSQPPSPVSSSELPPQAGV